MKYYIITCCIIICNTLSISAQTLEAYKKALETASNTVDSISLLVRIADFYESQAQYKESIVYNLKVESLERKIGINAFTSGSLWYNAVRNMPVDSFKVILEALDQEYHLSYLYNNVSIAYRRKNTEFARLSAIRALDLAKSSGNKLEQAKAYRNWGYSLYRERKYEEAKLIFLQGANIATEAKDTFGMIINIEYLGAIEYGLYKLKAAEKHFNRVLSLGEAAKLNYSLNNIFMRFGALRILQGNYKSARTFHLKDLEHNETFRNGSLAAGYYNIAKTYQMEGMLDSALYFFQKSYGEFSAYNQEEELAAVMIEIGSCYKSLGIYDSATIYLQRAIEFAKKFNSPYREAEANKELSLLHFELGSTEEAMSYAKKVNEHYNSLDSNSPFIKIDGLEWRLVIAERMGQTDIAMNLVKEAIDTILANSINSELPTFLNWHGEIHMELKEWKNAQKQFEQAKKEADKMGMKRMESEILYNCAKVKQQLKNFPSALQDAQESLEIAQSISYTSFLPQINHLLAKLHSDSGNFEKAYTAQFQYTNLRDSLLSSEIRERIARIEAQYQIKEKILENERLQIEGERKTNLVIRRNIIIAFLTVIIGFITLSAIFYQNKSKQAAENRLRRQLTRDIHDDVGGILSLMQKTTKEVIEEHSNKKIIESKLKQILSLSSHATNSLKNLIWKVEQKDTFLIHLKNEIKSHSAYVFSINKTPYELIIEGFDSPAKLSFKTYHNLLMIYKEAVQNILKHGNDKNIHIELIYSNNSFKFKAKNQMPTLRASTFSNGNVMKNGLANMKKRAALINGNINFKENEKVFEVELTTTI